jgi:selenide,water dikinase
LDADKITDTKNLYQSTDIISSIINDPYKLGMLSAKHALNDILASNSKALSSQMIVSMPPALNKINIRDLTQLKKGAEVIMKKSVCDITGGHTYSSNDDQIYIGYSIVGRQKTINKQNYSSEGFVYMTGHIGTAIIFAAIEQKILSGAYSKQVIKEMTASNHKIYELLCKNNVNMITDISGFGLAIHLYNLILRFPRLKGIELSINQVPIYPGVELALSKNVKSSLNDANKNYIISKLNHSNKNHKLSNILYDPQTAGGFVFVVNDNKEKILNDFSKNNIDLSLIGKIKNTNKKITVI